MKNLLNFGKALDAAEQKSINGGKGGNSCGGGGTECYKDSQCDDLFPDGICYYGCCVSLGVEPYHH